VKPIFSRRLSPQRTLLVVFAVVLVLVIGAEIAYLAHKHSSKSGATAPSTTANSSVRTTTTAGTAATGTRPTSPFPSYVSNVSLRPDVSTTSCEASSGGWTASGVIDNKQSSAHDFRLTVYFTDSHATVLSAGQTSVAVEPNSIKPWSIASKFNAPPGVVCVLVGVQ